MKTMYETPAIEVINFNTEDVITTSGGLIDGGYDGVGDVTPW